MRSVVLGSLRLHTRRYVAALVAVVIGVTFVVATDALASSTRAGMVADLDVPYRAADRVVSDLDGDAAAALLERAAGRGESAGVVGWTLQPVSGEGLAVERVPVGVVADDPALRWQVLEQGRLPEVGGEAVADVNAAKSSGVAVGDRLRVGVGDRASEVTVVGLVDTPSSSARAALYLPWSDVTRWRDSLSVDSVAYAGDPGAAVGASGAVIETVDDFVERRAAELSGGADVVAYVLLLFAAVALSVSVLVIANTFSILFAQRSRDLALLRCVGATRRQVVRGVRTEALVVGLVASAAGVLVGVGTGLGIVAAVRGLLPGAPLGPVTFSPLWLAGAFVLGLGVTLVASWLPTRRVVATTPLDALRPDTGVEVRSAAGRLRVATGVVLVVGGAAGLGLAVAATQVVVMLVGGMSFFAGLLLLGPLVVPALLRLAGPVAGRVGPAARLAAGNTVRNPRRSAATTASLLIGVTLTTAVLTGLASSRGAVDDEMARQHPLDVTVTAADLPETAYDDLAALDGVAAAVRVPGVAAEVSDGVGRLPLVAAPDGLGEVAHAGLPTPPDGTVALPFDLAAGVDRVTVTTTAGSRTMQVVRGEGWGTAGLVSPETLTSLAPAPATAAVWLRATPGADAEDLAGDVAAVARDLGAEQTSGVAQRRYVDLQLDVLTASVVGLLGIAVVIALVGIGNTLGLSVLERGREHALLRALGLTRRQLRATLAVEAVLLSLVATLLGTVVGVLYAWVGVQTMVRPVVADAVVTLPWGQLGLVLLVAGLAGLAAAVLPSRRAVRVAPARGLAQD